MNLYDYELGLSGYEYLSIAACVLCRSAQRMRTHPDGTDAWAFVGMSRRVRVRSSPVTSHAYIHGEHSVGHIYRTRLATLSSATGP